MSDDMTPDTTNHDRRLAHSWAETVKANPECWGQRQLAAARVILTDLPDPPPPTLADMLPKDRVGCKGMQADLDGDDSQVVIVTTRWLNDSARVMWPDFRIGAVPQRCVTPRPDLPRMEWPGTEKPAPAPDSTPTEQEQKQ